LYIVDIRNEWKHIPAFDSVAKFTYFLMDNRNRRFIKFPTNPKFFHEGQFRFAFNTKKELLTLFTYFKHFRNCTIVVDEADALFSDRHFQSALTDVFLGSRNNNVTMIFVGKRPYLIPILVRSQVDRFTIFRTDEKRDIDYLEERSKSLPKNPRDLKLGEAIIIEQDNEARIEQFQRFEGEN
jgi:hypothetical protein